MKEKRKWNWFKDIKDQWNNLQPEERGYCKGYFVALTGAVIGAIIGTNNLVKHKNKEIVKAYADGAEIGYYTGRIASYKDMFTNTDKVFSDMKKLDPTMETFKF